MGKLHDGWKSAKSKYGKGIEIPKEDLGSLMDKYEEQTAAMLKKSEAIKHARESIKTDFTTWQETTKALIEKTTKYSKSIESQAKGDSDKPIHKLMEALNEAIFTIRDNGKGVITGYNDAIK